MLSLPSQKPSLLSQSHSEWQLFGVPEPNFNVCAWRGTPHHQQAMFQSQAGCLTIQLNSDTTRRQHHIPQVKGWVLQALCFWPIAINQRFPQPFPSLGLINSPEQLTELRGTFYLWEQHQSIVKGCKKEKVHRAKHGERGWSFYALSRHSTLLASPCICQTGSSWNPVLWIFIHYMGIID